MTQYVEIVPMRILPKEIEATTFNLVRLALLRVADPLQISLTNHRCLDIVLSQEQWLCIDTCCNDQPILAWRDFEMQQRDALHRPIKCKLYLYHTHAGLIMGTALEALATAVAELCRPGSDDHYPLSVLAHE